MEKNDGSSSKSTTGDVEEHGDSSAKRIKCSIEEAAFCCDLCTEPLRPPIFQCPGGHIFCSPCRDKQLPEEKCTFGSAGCTAGTLARSLGMERAVESILVDCHYAEHGCTETTAYCHPANHWLACPHAPCGCPEPGCGFAGKAAELPAHLAAGRHGWPSTAFQYWVPFDLRVGEPGTHLLRCSNDGRLFLVGVQPAAAEPPAGLAVSLVSVEYLAKPAAFQCSVSFSYSARHRGTSTWELRPLRFYDSWPPKDYICVVPSKVSGGPDGAAGGGMVLTVNISCIHAVDEEDDLDDSSYVESDEDDDNESMTDEDDSDSMTDEDANS